MDEYKGTIEGRILDTEDIQKELQPTKITKIEFDNPIIMHQGDSLRVNFVFTPEGMKCDVALETADGKVMIVGEDVEDVVEGQ